MLRMKPGKCSGTKPYPQLSDSAFPATSGWIYHQDLISFMKMAAASCRAAQLSAPRCTQTMYSEGLFVLIHCSCPHDPHKHCPLLTWRSGNQKPVHYSCLQSKSRDQQVLFKKPQTPGYLTVQFLRCVLIAGRLQVSWRLSLLEVSVRAGMQLSWRCLPNTKGPESDGQKVQDHPKLHGKLEPTLGTTNYCIEVNKQMKPVLTTLPIVDSQNYILGTVMRSTLCTPISKTTLKTPSTTSYPVTVFPFSFLIIYPSGYFALKDGVFLHCPDQPQTPDPPLSTFQVLGLHACTTIPSLTSHLKL